MLIENEQDGRVSATVLGLPDFKSFGASKEEALDKLIQLLQERKPEISSKRITEQGFSGFSRNSGNPTDMGCF
ncbi:hypothetical protein LC608_26280 [Nostoc sp. XA010]|uniref:hypothetical protein n=1 Tax=Nostoc sp. XA010 TaxID=2780407 RepID=UPI001E31D871|nr:hypothetical protein [Nostoc sp. XA010]MCC5660422.1 hypothetical protein [Nostoc sp. XA010]